MASTRLPLAPGCHSLKMDLLTSSRTPLSARSLTLRMPKLESFPTFFSNINTLSPGLNSSILPRNYKAARTRSLFTGIVEEMGRVRSLDSVVADNGNLGYELIVEAKTVLEDVKLGDSISVNGTCLTVTWFDSEAFKVGLAPETLRRTSLVEAKVGGSVNLERSLQPTSRMGGHFVQGHVDGTGTIISMTPDGDSMWIKVKTSQDILRYVVSKGYIAVDGTSLTVVDVLDDETAFTFMLVAYSQQKVVIPLKKVGDKVNLEVDILGKYVERMLHGHLASVSSSVPA